MGITSETWRPVLGFEDYYEVSSRGRVRSLDRMVYAGRGRMRKSVGRLRKLYKGDRYIKVPLKVDGKQTGKNVHVLVAEAFLGPRPEGMQVCHNNGNSHDNRVENLRFDTPRANSLDQRKHGTAFSRRDKPQCYNGHPYAPGSFYVDGQSGKRVCLACESERGKRRRARKHELNGTVPRSERTECLYGHPLDGMSNQGKRFCTTCNREAQRRYRASKAGGT
jgi:hypothetical protein